MKWVAIAICVLLGGVSTARAEDGYELWLRYQRIADGALLNHYRSAVTSLVAGSESATGRVTASELSRGLRGLFGKLDQQRDFLTLYVPELEIAANLPALAVALDGETLTLATPLRYRIRPRALILIAPAPPPPPAAEPAPER